MLRRLGAQAAIALVAFTLASSWAFVYGADLSLNYPFPVYQFWRYLYCCRANPIVSQWLMVAGVGGLLGAAAAVLVAKRASGPAPQPLGLVGAFLAKRPMRTGWPLRRSIPAGGDVPEAIRGSTGRARVKTIEEMQTLWKGADRKDGCGIVMGEADDPRRYEGPLDPRDQSTWGNGGKAPLLINDCRATPHNLIFAGSQKFKTTGHVIPTLLTWRGPAVVFDPKEELHGMLVRARSRMDHDVHDLSPGRNGFDALEWIDPTSTSFSRDVAAQVDLVCGNTPIADKKAAFFKSRGKTLVRCVILDMLLDTQMPRALKTLATFRQRVGVSSADLGVLLERLATQSAPMVRERAAPLRSDLDNAPEMFAGFQSSLEDDTEWLSDPALASLVSGDAFRASDLLNGATDVFLPLDFDVLKTSPGVVRCLIGSLMNAAYKAKGNLAKRILFSIDEADKVGRLDIIEKVRDTGASFGINLDMAWQSPGQLRDRWGVGGQQAWYASATRTYAAVADFATAKEVSDSMGDRGVLAGSVSENTGTSRQGFAGRASRSKSKNFSYNWQRQKQLSPEEIMYQLRPDAGLVFSPGGGWPVICTRALAFRRADMNELVDWP